MLLPFCRNLYDGGDVKSYAIIEGLVIVPIVAAALAYLFAFLPIPTWVQRSGVSIMVVFAIFRYVSFVRR